MYPTLFALLFCATLQHILPFQSQVFAQAVVLKDLPAGPAAGSYRFLPALSVNGFDCNAPNQACGHGLGLRQILEQAAHPEHHPETARLLQAIVQFAGQHLQPATDRHAVKHNTLVAEFRGFLSLATLLLEENGYTGAHFPSTPFPSHNQALALFAEVLDTPSAITFDEALSDDAVKWTGPLGSLARTVDFYLALEVAYRHYDRSGETLFSCDKKGALLSLLQDQIVRVDALGNRSVMDLHFIEILGFDIASVIRDISYDEVQAGNWPMKVHAAVGYASIIAQQPDTTACDLFKPVDTYARWLGRALRSIAGPDAENRSHHWAYQTAGGQRFWAEGPFYFNYGLATAVPFLHAARAHNLLDANDDFSVDDPFYATWFLNPVDGFADLVTPEGATPPLEDGNKIPMEAAFLLRWSGAYGHPGTGARFAWIADAQSALPSADLWLHALALPLAVRQTPPAPTLAPQPAGPHVPQIILRRDAQTGSCNLLPQDRKTPCHYVLLNGETPASIRPGEGHEQSDQLQLLYYVDDTSFLIDGGYDSAPGIQNSTWSDYRHHNVMTADRVGLRGGHGGLPGPAAGLACTRKVNAPLGEIVLPAACMYADHHAIEHWQHQQFGRIDQIEAALSIFPDAPLDNDEVFYKRTLFFIDDDAAPYLIDINTAQVKTDSLWDQVVLQMQYHGNAALSERQEDPSTALWRALWAAPDSLGSVPAAGPHDLSIQTFALEADRAIDLTPDVFREVSLSAIGAGEGLAVNRLTLSNDGEDGIATPSHTTVAFIQPRLGNAGQSAYPASFVTQSNQAGATPRPWQAYVWVLDETTVDVLLVQSPAPDAPLITPITMPSGKIWAPVTDFHTPGISFDGQTGTVSLNTGVSAGFMRLSAAGDVGLQETGRDTMTLEQNSPNPFNASTEIRFALQAAQRIRVDIFDVLGRHVASLFEGVKSAGRHVLRWEPRNVADGVYFYRLQTPAGVHIKQMAIVRR